jgi:hypothetical protein
MKRLILLAMLIGVTSCKSTKTANTSTEDPFVVENLAAYNINEIKQKHPDANMKEDVGMFEEGTEEYPYCILYPGTPDELHITWANEERTTINDIRFTEAGKWKSREGIKPGTTYRELNELNGKPISFYGFGWDYSGAVAWNEGRLENSNLRVFLAPKNEPKNKFYGDFIIDATEEEIEDLDLKVQTVVYKP